MTESLKLLFIGDSITESGRFEDPENLGQNYVRLIHDFLQVTYPSRPPIIINKGIGGDRVTDLAVRWEKDVIQLEPDIVSISIGVNDVWRQLDQPTMEQISPERFKEIYSDLLKQVQEKTMATIILMEPTIIEEDPTSKGNQLLIPYVQAVNELAKEYETMVVNTHEQFISFLNVSNYPLTTDGVHMRPAGNMLMAKAWLHRAYALFDMKSQHKSN